MSLGLAGPIPHSKWTDYANRVNQKNQTILAESVSAREISRYNSNSSTGSGRTDGFSVGPLRTLTICEKAFKSPLSIVRERPRPLKCPGSRYLRQEHCL